MGFALMLLIVSCKKEDVQQVNPSTKISSGNKVSGWNSLSNWIKSEIDSTTAYSTKITDTSINSDVIKSGLVLLFKKNGNEIQSLPFQQKETKSYWYYQVSKGSIRVTSANNEQGQSLADQFYYFVLSSQKLSTLAASGKTKLDLMQLTFEQASTLLK